MVRFFDIKILLLSILFVSFFASCVTTKKVKTNTAASAYNLLSYTLHPEFKVFHERDKSSKLYIKLYTGELRFSRANKENIYKAVVKVKYKLTPSFTDKNVIDTVSKIINVRKKARQTSAITYINLDSIELDKYLLTVELKDVYGKISSKSHIVVDRETKDNEQFYFSEKFNNRKPLFKEYFHSQDTIKIRHKNTFLKKMFVKYYKLGNSIPLPPYSNLKLQTTDIMPDSLWSIKVKGWSAIFVGNKKGIYRILSDSSSNGGMMKVNFGKYFPMLKTSDKLLESLQYLLSSDEYDEMRKSKNKKLAIDNFWLKAANNNESQAKQLLKIWYTRATHANLFFSTYREGWRTDKGMIYMVFGPPQIVKYTDGAERWTYTDRKRIKPVHFIFEKKKSISKNHFELIRSFKYSAYWYNAIDTWRKGKIFNY